MSLEFHPDSEMIRLYHLYLVSAVSLFFLSWMIPVVIAAFIFTTFNYALILTASLFTPLFLTVSYVAFWTPKYYSSVKYTLTEDEIIVERGVYWKTKSFVPYNRITNVEIVQGPLSRHFGLGTIKIQTAGFSAGSSGTKTAEAVIQNIKNFEELKDKIMNFVRIFRPVAVETELETSKSINEQVLLELRRIRELLRKPDGS